jgi:hypothetical protein
VPGRVVDAEDEGWNRPAAFPDLHAEDQERGETEGRGSPGNAPGGFAGLPG